MGDTVIVNNPKPGFLAVGPVVKKHLAPVTYLVETQSGQTWKPYIDHILLALLLCYYY